MIVDGIGCVEVGVGAARFGWVTIVLATVLSGLAVLSGVRRSGVVGMDVAASAASIRVGLDDGVAVAIIAGDSVTTAWVGGKRAVSPTSSMIATQHSASTKLCDLDNRLMRLA